MLNFYNHQPFTHFTADVFMCEQRHTGNGLIYWNLRLLSEGNLIDAFHWDNQDCPMLNYHEKDGIFVFGHWNTSQKNRFQVLQSKMVTSFAANDDVYDPDEPQQLEFDFTYPNDDQSLLLKGTG